MDATKSTLLQPDLGLALVAARDGRSAAERAAQAQRNRVDSLAYQAAAARKDIAATLAKAARVRELKDRDAKLAAAAAKTEPDALATCWQPPHQVLPIQRKSTVAECMAVRRRSISARAR